MTTEAKLIDNPSLKGREDKFTILEVDLGKIVKDWKASLYSFEWLKPDGNVRTPDLLTTEYRHQYNNVHTIYINNGPLERPVLGLGMMDNVEIGSRREVLLTLYGLGVKRMSVHVPISCLKDFKKFI